jgi:hypothetical protein
MADPAVTLTAPPANVTTVYPAGAVPAAEFNCTADPASTLSGCSAIADATGSPLDSGAALPAVSGVHSVVVTALDADGGTATATGNYDVENPPAATITAPADGQTFAVGQSVLTSFACAPGDQTPGRPMCTDSAGATDGDGALDTTTPGPHTYTVTAVQDTLTTTAQISYAVMAKPPVVSVSEPVNNGDYLWQSLPAAAYGCSAGSGAVLKSCTATSAGAPVADGGALPDGLGSHTLAITATDTDGQTTTQSVMYTAALSLAPPVSIQAPAGHGTYRLGQRVIALYSCGVRPSGSPLSACTGTVPSGHPVSTSTLGRHSFSAKAVDTSGQSSAESITYTVVPTTNRFTVNGLGAAGRGVARVSVTLPGPGRLGVVGDAWSTAGPAALRRHIVYATVKRHARGAGPLRLSVIPNGRGRALLKAAGAEPVLALAITYTPTGAAPHVVRPKALRLH